MQNYKHIFSTILILIISQTIFAQQPDSTHIAGKTLFDSSIVNVNYQPTIIDSVIQFSKQHLGKPYRGGSEGPNGFDCSGFTSFVFKHFGIKLGRSSSDQAQQLPSVQKSDILPGDLVFFNGHRRGKRVGHVGLVTSTDGQGNFEFIHSSSSAGISFSHSESNYYRNRYVGAGRVFFMDNEQNKLVSHNSIQQIPVLATNPEKTETTNFTQVKKTIPAKYHTVKSGETLSSIAAKYGLTVKQLKKKNNLKKDFLALKQRLKISEEREIITEVAAKPIPKTATKPDTLTAQKQTTTLVRDTEQKTVKHTVTKGETLYSLSKQYGISIQKLTEINQLKNNRLNIGQTIFISQETIVSTQSTSEKSAPVLTQNQQTDSVKISSKPEIKKTPKPKTKTYVVKSGDTLSSIAEKYDCTVKQLKNWNGKKSSSLQIGEKIRIVI